LFVVEPVLIVDASTNSLYFFPQVFLCCCSLEKKKRKEIEIFNLALGVF